MVPFLSYRPSNRFGSSNSSNEPKGFVSLATIVKSRVPFVAIKPVKELALSRYDGGLL